jgi:hypothetical protein
MRAHAAWGLGRLARLAPSVRETARQALAERHAAESDPAVLLELNNALEALEA